MSWPGDDAPGDDDAVYWQLDRWALDRQRGMGRRAMRDHVLLVWEMNGEQLPSKHGDPLRLINPGHYGMTSGIRATDRAGDERCRAGCIGRSTWLAPGRRRRQQSGIDTTRR